MLKINMSIAIVCMVNNTAVNSHFMKNAKNLSNEIEIGCVSSVTHDKMIVNSFI